MTISILGTEYEIVKRDYNDDPRFKDQEIDGYCDGLTKQIVCCNMQTYPGWQDDGSKQLSIAEKQILRHEIVHAFFDESGLASSTSAIDGPWAMHEEMVDWIALQGPKIYRAWQEADAL